MSRSLRDRLTLAACVICPGLMLGVMLCFPLWVPGWMREFGTDRSGVMLVYSIAGLLMTVTMAFVGRLLIRIPAWRLVATGAVVIGLGLLLASRIHNFYAFAAVYSLSIGIGVALSSLLPCQYLAVRLFPERMGAIAGLIMLAMAGAGVIFPLVLTPLVGAVGWRIAIAATGLVAMGLALLMSLTLMRTAHVEAPKVVPGGPAHAPAGHGGAGHGAAASGAAMGVVRPLATGEIVRSAPFWIIVVATMPLLGTPTAVQTNFLPILKDRGIDAHEASLVLSVLGVGTAIGALLFGWLGDRIPPRLLTMGIAAVMSLSLLGFASGHGLGMLMVASVLMGTASGGTLPLSSVLTFRQFGAGYAPVFGLLQVFILPYMFTPPAIGWVRDHSGSYTPVLLALIPVLLLCAAATWRLRLAVTAPRPVAAHVAAE